MNVIQYVSPTIKVLIMVLHAFDLGFYNNCQRRRTDV